MRPGRLNSLVSVPSVLVALLLFFGTPATTAAAWTADVRTGHRIAPNDDGSRPSPASTFPLITRLRDAAIEFVFGKHPSSLPRSGGRGSGRGGQYTSSSLYEPARYSTQTVIRFNITTADEEAALAEAASQLFLDIWAFNNHTGMVDLRLHKDDVASLLTLLPESLHYAFAPLIPDLAVAVQSTYPRAAAAADKGAAAARLAELASSGRSTSATGIAAALGTGLDNVYFQDYQPLPVIEQWMRLMDVMFPFVEMITIGQSAEGREILGLRIGATERNGNGNEPGGEPGNDEPEGPGAFTKRQAVTPEEPEHPGPKKRKTIVVTGGLHAREWITTSTVNYVAWSVIAGYGKARLITKLLEHFDVVFLPVVNPDGYEYTWHTDRLWRKTRQGTNFQYCRGLDLDHAFGYEWDGNARMEPCSETYGGEAAFQAVEAQALATWARGEVLLRNVELVGFLDLHSYSQQILFPFSYSCTADPPNLENLEELAAGLAKAIRLATGEQYSTSSACEGVIGRADRQTKTGTDAAPDVRLETGGGSAIDWFYHEMRARYSYQIKLRDTGSYGFLLPPSEIVPTGEEMFSAFKYFADYLLGNNGIERSFAEAEAAVTEGTGDSNDDDGKTELRRRAHQG